MKIMTVVGARPQFIKAAAVNRAIRGFNRKASARRRTGNSIREILVHTGQHYDYLMDRVFFEELRLPKPDYHLEAGSGFHGRQTGIMLERIEPILQKEEPEMVLVYGDTNSTLAGSLAAAKLCIPVAHIEAGLRSYDPDMPEEINRVLTDHLSRLLFCPTGQAVKNLSKEGIRDGREGRSVKNVGDVMYDSISYYSELAEIESTILGDLGLVSEDRPAANSGPRVSEYYLATLHRAENTDDPRRLGSILEALNVIGRRADLVFPLHPRTRKMMKTHGLSPGSKKIKVIAPVSYLNMLKLERNAKIILTDSGGVQKEAYWLRIPCITLREGTEWDYTKTGGWNLVSGWKTSKILNSVAEIESEKWEKRGVLRPSDHKASEEILRFLTQ